MEAVHHPLQRERLAALHSFEILDTDPEQDFDDIVKLAAATCGTSISVVNFIDAERQWFKAETGLGVRETPLATSICAHVILEDEFVEIHDTLDDARMRDNPLCCGDPGLRFYAGALLRTAEGLPLGTLCVLDYAPMTLTALQRDTLRVLARQVIALLESRKALRTADMLRLEVDHRVKNSLQALTSFARLQRRAFASEEAKLALTMIMTRIDSLVHLHHQLYETNEHLAVELGEYISRVCGHLRGIAPPGVIVAVEADRVIVTADQAAAVGTYLNEFIANSFKHGFPEGREGAVSISLRLTETGAVRLSCSDNGVGLPADLKPAPTGLGMRIVEIVCMELESELDLRNGPAGVIATLTFEPRAPALELPWA